VKLTTAGAIRSATNFADVELVANNGSGFRWALDGSNNLLLQGTTNTFSGVSVTPLTILTGGNIGIGSSTPDAALEVNGTVHIDGNNGGGLAKDNGQLIIRGASNYNAQLQIGYDTTDSYAWLQSAVWGSAYTNLVLNPGGGNVGIGVGNTSPNYPLDILRTTNGEGLYVTAGVGGTNIATFARTSGATASVSINGSGGDPQLTFTRSSTDYALGDDNGVFKLSGSSAVGTSDLFTVSSANTSSNIFEVATSTGTAYLDITAAGNVGIGSTSPASKLTVVGGGICISGSGATVACGNTAGTLYYRSASSNTYDVAENYLASDLSLAPGNLATLDLSGNATVGKGVFGAVPFGVVSTAPGLLLGGADGTVDASKMRAIALTGRVPVKVNLDGGPIAVGDPITLSSTPGVGQKATTTAEIVGIALTPYSGHGTSTIEVFVRPEYRFSDKDKAALADILSFGSSTASTTIATGSFMDGFLKNLFGQVTKWLADAGNGIGNLFADKVHTKQICVGDPGNETCITKGQLDALLAGAAASGTTTDSGVTHSTSIIILNPDGSTTTPTGTDGVPVGDTGTPPASDTATTTPAGDAAAAGDSVGADAAGSTPQASAGSSDESGSAPPSSGGDAGGSVSSGDAGAAPGA
jgi:hypothetical protein